MLNTVSTNVRIEYIKDALKIFKTSPIVGRGGEAFRLLYKQVTTESYYSTEVHSSFIQILAESGILGFSCILAFILYKIINCSNSINKFIFILFSIHATFDLDFSYNISILFFGIITGILKNKKNIKKY